MNRRTGDRKHASGRLTGDRVPVGSELALAVDESH